MSTQSTEHVQEQPRNRIQRIREAWRGLRGSLMWTSIEHQKWWWLMGATAAVTSALFANMTLGAMARLIDAGVIEQTEPMLWLFLRLAVLAVATAVTGFGLRMAIDRVGLHMEYELRNWLYQGLHSLDPRRLDSVASGQMVTRAMTDLWLFLVFIVFLPALAVYCMMILGRISWLLMQSVPMTIIVCLALPINLYLVKRMRNRMWGFSWLSLNRRAEVTSSFDETVRGIRVVKAFGREDEERSKLADIAGKTFGVTMARIRVLAKFDLLLKATPMAINVVLVVVAARFIAADTITIGVFVAFLEGARHIARFASTFDNIVNIYMWGKAGAGRIYELLGLLEKNVEGPRTGDPVPPPSTGLEVEGAGVSFGGHPVLSDLSLTVRRGELVVVTGPPRSGRSTIAQLVSGAIPSHEGRVVLDGADVTALDPNELRRVVLAVPEDAFLFARSVRENLLMGAHGEDVSDEELLDAVWAAGAEDVLANMHAGLDTILADRGMNLSGGERQRVALARALVRPPRMLVLDDALTAVNPAFEVEILERVRQHAPDTAVLCLTRRDAATRHADRVVELPEPAPGAPPGPEPLELGPYGTMRDMPYDPKLIDIISTELPPGDDRPRVAEDACNSSDEPPGVRSTLEPLKKPVAFATFLLVGFTLLGLAPPRIYGYITDALSGENFWLSDQMALLLGGVTVAYAIFAYYLRIYRTKVEESIMYVLRRRVVHRITRLGVDYYDRESPGYMSARVVNDIDKIGKFVDSAVYKSAVAVLQLVVVMAIMLWWNPPAALVALGAAPVIIALSLWLVPIIARAYVWVRTETGEVVTRLQEDFMGRYEVQSYDARERTFAEFHERALRLRRARLWSAFVRNGYNELIEFVMLFAGALLLWSAGNQVLAGAITVGALAALRQYLDQVLDPLPELAGVLEEYLEARASIRRLREPFFATIRPPEHPAGHGTPPAGGVPPESAGNGAPPADRPPRPATPPGGLPVPASDLRLRGEISFDDVTFTYPETRRPVLENASLQVASGQMLAIVGPTGAGKSSIVKLICRVYDPDGGRVLMDGRDLRDIDYTAFRRRVGYVPQETFLFRGTVRGNVTYGCPGASTEQIEAAARAVGAYDSLKAIPGGFDGLVEEEGRNLTSAQRQLIALVRAWLVDPDILVLDEATAVLDAKMEKHVIDAVRKLGRTTILITHRLHVAKDADRIVVVAGGKLVEDGTHDELVQKQGVYSGLWEYGAEVDDRSMKQAAREHPVSAGGGSVDGTSWLESPEMLLDEQP